MTMTKLFIRQIYVILYNTSLVISWTSQVSRQNVKIWFTRRPRASTPEKLSLVNHPRIQFGFYGHWKSSIRNPRVIVRREIIQDSRGNIWMMMSQHIRI